MEIITLLKANIKHKKGNFISILILMLIISAVLTSVVSIQDNMNSRAKEAHKSVDTGDLIIYLDQKSLTKEMLAKAEACNSVEKVWADHVFNIHHVYINDEQFTSSFFIQAFPNDNYPYELFNEEGTDFVSAKDTLQDTEILLPISIRDMYSCKIGDAVSFNFGSKTINLTIAGFIEEPLSGSNVMGIKNTVVTEKIFQQVYDITKTVTPGEQEYAWDGTFVHVFATEAYKNNITEMSKELNSSTNMVSLGVTSLTKEQSVTYTLLVTNIICGVLESFVLILFVVVILVMSNSINSSIEMEYTNIGILKSQGFDKFQIRIVLLLQYLLSCILGGLLGIVLSIPLVRMLRGLFISTSGLLLSRSIYIVKSTGLLLIIVLILALFILFKTRKVAKISPINAISGGLDTVYFKNILQTPVMGKSKSLLSLKLAFRQLTTNSKWYMGTMLIIGILASFLCMCASFKETFTEKYYNELFGVVQSDIVVYYNNDLILKPQVEKTISDISPIKARFHSDTVYVLIDGEQDMAQVLDDCSYLTSILKGRAPKYDNEIAVTNLLSNQLDKTIGDTVEIQVKEIKKEYLITAIYDSCADVGRCFAITLDGIYRVVPDYKVDTNEYFLEDPGKATAVIEAINDKYSHNTQISAEAPSSMNQTTIDTIMMTSNIVTLSIFMIAIIFAIIVIFMISNKMFAKEKQTLGIYKAFGFTVIGLRFQYCFRFLFVAILGCVLGGTIYILFGNDLNSSVLKLAGVSSYSAPITFFNLLLPVGIICLTVFISSYVAMRKVKKVDVKMLIVE